MAAGLGFKTFTTGEVLTSADTNGYLMQGVLVFASAAARDAAITSPQEGQFAYLKDTNVTTYYTGSAWANLDTTGMTNPMTTTGDIIYSSSGSTPARLGIGTTGQVVTVASGLPSWATPATGGGLTVIATGSLSGSSVVISSIPATYKHLMLSIYGATWNSANETPGVHYNAVTTNYTRSIYGHNNVTAVNGGASNRGSIEFSDASEDWLRTSGLNHINCMFYDYLNTTGIVNVAATYNFVNASSTYSKAEGVYSNQATATAITSLTFKTSSSYTLTAGTYTLYGVS